MPRARSTKRGGGRIMVANGVGDGGGAAVPRIGEGGGVSAEGANRERTRLPAAGTTTPFPESHTPAVAAASAATAATYARLAQRSSTRLALQRSTFSPSLSAAANPSSVRRRHRSTRVNGLADKGAAATPARGGGLAGGRQVGTAVSVAVPTRASRRLSGGEALVSMRDANDNLDRVVFLRKRKSAGGAVAVTSAGAAAKKHRATGQQQQQQQQQAGQKPFGPSDAVDSNPNPNPTPGVAGGFDASNDVRARARASARAAGADASADASVDASANASADTSADAGAASDIIAPGPKPGAARKMLSTNLSWPPSRLASITTACVPTSAFDDHHTSNILGTCAAATRASATSLTTRATGSGGRAERVLRTTVPAAPLSTAVVPGNGTAGRRRDAETGLLVKGGAFTAAGGANTLGAIPAAPSGQQRAEARRQVLPPLPQQQQQHGGQDKEGEVAERVGAGVVATPTVGTTGTTAMMLQPMSAIDAAAAAAATAALVARAAAAAAAAVVTSVGSEESKAPRSTAQVAAAAAAAGDSGGPVRADFTGWHSWPKTRQGSRPEDGGIEDASGKVDMNGSGAGLAPLQASPYPCSEGGAGEKNGSESSGDVTGGGGSSGTKDEEGRRLEKKQEPADPKQKVRAQTPAEQEIPEPAAPKPEPPKEQVPKQQHKPLQQQPPTPEPPPQTAPTASPSNPNAPERKDPRRESLKWNGTASGGGRASGISGSGRTLRKTTANATRSRSNPVAAGGSAANDFAAIPPTGVRGGKPGRGSPIGGPRRAQREAAAAAAAMSPGRSRTATVGAAGAAATRANARTPGRSPSSEKVAVGSCSASTRGKRKRQGGDGGGALPSKTPRSPGCHATALGVAAVAVSAAAAVFPPGTVNTHLQMPEKMRPSSQRGSGGGGGRGGRKADEDRSGESSWSIPNVESTELEDNSGGGGKACEDRNGEGSGSVSMVEGTDVGDESAGAGAGGKSREDRTGEGSRIVSTVEGNDPGDDPGGGGNDGLPAVVGRGSAPVAAAAIGGTADADSARQVNNSPGEGKAGRARRDKKNKKKKGAVGSPPNAAVEVRFLKSKEAHAVPHTPTPRYYLPADQSGPIIEDAAGVPTTEQGDGIGGGRRFRPALSEGGADVVWDRRRFKLTVPANVGGGGGGGGGCCCGGAAVDVATMEEAGCLSADSSPETAGSPPHGSDGGNGGHDKGQGKDQPPPRDCTPRARKKKRTLTLREKQDEIFETLVNSGRQKDLITPQEYGHAGGYFGDREQPFKVVVHPHVHFVADAHAYMMEKNEVIGWLGGWFDEENKVLYVQTAVPCREDQELSGGARGMTEVSMCQASSFHTSEAIRGRRLQLVGWYHSHPKFVNDPSPIDVENHQMFQKDENGEGSSGAWVGLIVGRKASPSDFRWFRNAHVERVVRDENGEVVHTETVLCPMLLRTHLASSVMSPAATAAAAVAKALESASTPEDETAAGIEALTSETGSAALTTVGATVGGKAAAAGTDSASSNTAPLPNTESARTPRAECLASHSAEHLNVHHDRRLCASGGWKEASVLAGGTGEGAQGGGVDVAVDVSLRQQQQRQRQQRKRGRAVARARAAAKALERAGEKSVTHPVVKNLDDTLHAAAPPAATAAAVDGGGDGDAGRAAALAAVAPTSNNGGSESPLLPHAPAAVRVPADTDNTTAVAIDADSPPIGLPQKGSAVHGVNVPPDDVMQQAGNLGAATLDAIIAIAKDPPLVMSEEALEVLKGATGGGSGEGFEGYGPKMDRIVESVTSLGRYYAGVSGRASLSNGAKAGMPTLAKLARSLAQTVQHMELDPPEAGEFIYDACFFLLACFRETNVRIASQQRGIGVGKKRKEPGGGGRVCRDPPPPVQKKSRRGKK